MLMMNGQMKNGVLLFATASILALLPPPGRLISTGMLNTLSIFGLPTYGKSSADLGNVPNHIYSPTPNKTEKKELFVHS
jgi:hypothetical protein